MDLAQEDPETDGSMDLAQDPEDDGSMDLAQDPEDDGSMAELDDEYRAQIQTTGAEFKNDADYFKYMAKLSQQ